MRNRLSFRILWLWAALLIIISLTIIIALRVRPHPRSNKTILSSVPPLQPFDLILDIEGVHGLMLGDYTNRRIVVFDITNVRENDLRYGRVRRTGYAYVYDWEGVEQWRFPLPNNDPYIYWRKDTDGDWATPDWLALFSTTDRLLYNEDNRFNQVVDHLFRFSPDGELLGVLAYEKNRIIVSLWKQGKRRWQAPLAMSAIGLNDRNIIDLLVNNEGRVILYTADLTIYDNHNTPIASLKQGQLSKKDIEEKYQQTINAYVTALGGPPPQKHLKWKKFSDSVHVLGCSPYARYLFCFEILHETDSTLDIGSIGEVALYVLEYPGIVRARLVVPAERCDDIMTVTLKLPDGQEVQMGNYSTVYFSPDCTRLLIDGKILMKFQTTASSAAALIQPDADI